MHCAPALYTAHTADTAHNHHDARLASPGQLTSTHTQNMARGCTVGPGRRIHYTHRWQGARQQLLFLAATPPFISGSWRSYERRGCEWLHDLLLQGELRWALEVVVVLLPH